MSTEPQRTCPSCGNEFSGAMKFCPVCVLRKALADGVESGESSASEEMVKPTLEQAVQRFEHYELVKGEDGKPVELGRGAMGVTYKAFDVDLHCPVTLKVINEKLLAACPQAHWLEYQDWAAPILEQPLEVRDGVALPQVEAGCGLAWNKDAVERYRLR
jgi:hypothetical protein